MMKLSVEKLHITSLQKAYGALKDSTAVGLVGLAKANSEFKFEKHMYVQVEMKMLIIVIHRMLREAWYCSAWDRTDALFLEERHKCYHVLKYDIEAECLVRA
ncbi:hypothetical protein IGI04_023786 [Brassica rapa subsp. trilocularis]|uniref:Uncharacterized protein n=2 Tax=Brassica campestris TaxID=3711 RepID=A0A3P5Z2E3_BRACM|nr:hypothetical protein IGI04_023786 [Brassica rapa subsp. trilocularis]CAG7871342.1 unnamed protein product [Brassica rapa]VDC67290.1 unnamed protein product [Brassica rapa]